MDKYRKDRWQQEKKESGGMCGVEARLNWWTNIGENTTMPSKSPSRGKSLVGQTPGARVLGRGSSPETRWPRRQLGKGVSRDATTRPLLPDDNNTFIWVTDTSTDIAGNFVRDS